MISTTGQRRISSPTDKSFIDSNVLIYSYDSADPRKQQVAAALVADILMQGNGAVSVQVLGEFFSSITRRIANPLSVEEAGRAVEAIGSSATLDVLNIDMEMVQRAIATHSRYGVTY